MTADEATLRETPEPPFEGWDEDSFYLPVAGWPDAAAAEIELRRYVAEMVGEAEADAGDYRFGRVTVPICRADEQNHHFDGECPHCVETDCWVLS